ncbi:MAG: hypothetical protein ACJ790_01670, partial [Myxococcaceae bacterium]
MNDSALTKAESQVPASYAEKAMASLLQLHSELMEEKERRVDLYRRLMEKEQSIAELKMYVKLLEEKLNTPRPPEPVRTATLEQVPGNIARSSVPNAQVSVAPPSAPTITMNVVPPAESSVNAAAASSSANPSAPRANASAPRASVPVNVAPSRSS